MSSPAPPELGPAIAGLEPGAVPWYDTAARLQKANPAQYVPPRRVTPVRTQSPAPCTLDGHLSTNAADSEPCPCSDSSGHGDRVSEQEARTVADDAWARCAHQLREHDENMVRAWKEDIDALLVFVFPQAGLFATALTAFEVQLYTSFTPDPNIALTNQLLAQISTQLSGLSPKDDSSVRLIHLPIPMDDSSGNPSWIIIWINALWFSSLVLSLCSTAIGTVVRQWLNYYISPTSSDPRQNARTHCFRYDFGLIPWRVPDILNFVPVLLSLALALFFFGLDLLLWTFTPVMACILSVIIWTLLAFIGFTTVAPMFRPDCPYKSPQALLAQQLLQNVSRSLPCRLVQRLFGDVAGFFRLRSHEQAHPTSQYAGLPLRAMPTSNIPPEGSSLRPSGSGPISKAARDLGVILRSFYAAVMTGFAVTRASMCKYAAPLPGERLTGDWREQEERLLSNESIIIYPCVLDPDMSLRMGLDVLSGLNRAASSAREHTMVDALAIELSEKVARTGSSADKIEFVLRLSSSNACGERNTVRGKVAVVAITRVWASAAIVDDELDRQVAEQLAVLGTDWRLAEVDERFTLPHSSTLVFSVPSLFAMEQLELQASSAAGLHTERVISACLMAITLSVSADKSCFEHHLQGATWTVIEAMCRAREVLLGVDARGFSSLLAPLVRRHNRAISRPRLRRCLWNISQIDEGYHRQMLDLLQEEAPACIEDFSMAGVLCGLSGVAIFVPSNQHMSPVFSSADRHPKLHALISVDCQDQMLQQAAHIIKPSRHAHLYVTTRPRGRRRKLPRMRTIS
ncbi:hypothetical protein OBBRIDRAFT_804658 [Obba rivulosa]|uniref:DUF6535 domain-containing protein n=1 Tax=Obba rivulosa TaxID=1052685 RepID=A0A8E2DJM3_9APHY|nr:hypothetical protein OBBRIDRAFT_804658 [Obba rivulosa]